MNGVLLCIYYKYFLFIILSITQRMNWHFRYADVDIGIQIRCFCRDKFEYPTRMENQSAKPHFTFCLLRGPLKSKPGDLFKFFVSAFLRREQKIYLSSAGNSSCTFSYACYFFGLILFLHYIIYLSQIVFEIF